MLFESKRLVRQKGVCNGSHVRVQGALKTTEGFWQTEDLQSMFFFEQMKGVLGILSIVASARRDQGSLHIHSNEYSQE